MVHHYIKLNKNSMPLITLQAKPSATGSNALVCKLGLLCGSAQEQFAAKLDVTLTPENYRSKLMPLAMRQLRMLLIQMSQSGIEANKQSAHLLLAQYFPQQEC